MASCACSTLAASEACTLGAVLRSARQALRAAASSGAAAVSLDSAAADDAADADVGEDDNALSSCATRSSAKVLRSTACLRACLPTPHGSRCHGGHLLALNRLPGCAPVRLSVAHPVLQAPGPRSNSVCAMPSQRHCSWLA